MMRIFCNCHTGNPEKIKGEKIKRWNFTISNTQVIQTTVNEIIEGLSMMMDLPYFL